MPDVNDQTIEIIIPEQTGLPTDAQSNPQGDNVENEPQTTTISTSNPQSVWEKDDCTEEECDHYKAWLKSQLPSKPKHRPCSYCADKDKYQSLVEDYLKKCRAKTGEKVQIPFIQEIADIFDVDRDTINDWANKKILDSQGKQTDELEHPDFFRTIKKIKNLQELRLLQRTLGRFNPTGAIFQLKTNHGYIETEKKVVTGDAAEPLMIEIISEKQLNPEE